MAKRVPSSQHLTPKKVEENSWAGTRWVDNYYGGRPGRPEPGTVTNICHSSAWDSEAGGSQAEVSG